MKKGFNPLFVILLLLGISANAQFVENKGQVLDVNQNLRPEVKFYYGAPEASIYFQKDKIVYAFQKKDAFDEKRYENDAKAKDSVKAKLGFTMYRLDMEFVGANPNPEIVHGEKIPGDIHFYLNERNGIRDVGSYKTITYKNIYNNIDVIFYELPTGLKYDIVLHEGSNIEDVKIFYNGAKNIAIDNKKVVIQTNYKTLEEAIPLAFIDGDKANEVEIEYTLGEKGILSFKKPQTAFKTLTIDPVLEWATYLNQPDASYSSSMDYYDNRLDEDGNTYIYGHCYNGANGYPVVNPGGSAYQASWVSYSDLYIAKFNANRTLVWGTYFGGSSSEMSISSQALALYGNTLHVVGGEMSAGAPYTNGGGFYAQNTSRPFWARFNKNTCQLEHLTSLPGGSSSTPSIAISNSGTVAIISHAYGDSFYNISIVNRPGAYNQATNGGYLDMYLMMFNPAYTQIWGTFLGGPSSQEYFMCAFDNSDNLYFMGETAWFASGANAGNATNERLVQLPGAYYQSTIAGGTDAMLGKFNSSGALVWHTLFGGNNGDVRRGQQGGFGKLLIHPTTQEPFIAFNTTSNNLPINNLTGAYNKTVPTHANFGGSSGSFWNYAAYIAKFSTAGVLNYSSYWHNGDGGDLIMDITWAGCDKLYIGGNSDRTNAGVALTGGFNMPTINSVNGRNTFITQVNSTSYAQEWASFITDNTASDPSITGHLNSPRVYVASKGYYNTIPTVDPGNGAYFNANGNAPTGSNFGIWQLHPSLPPQVTGDLAPCAGATTTLTASGGTGAPYNWYSGSSGGTAFHTGSSYTTGTLTTDVTYYVSSGSGMCESPRTPVAITVSPGGGTPFTVTGGGNLCSGGTGHPVGLNGSQAGVNYQLYLDGFAQGTPVGGTGSSISFGVQTNAGTYTVITSGGGSCATTMTGSVTISVLPTPSTPNFTVNSPVCSGSPINFNAPTVLGATYVWSGPNSFISSAEDPSIAISTTANTGTYNLYIVENTCTSGTASQTVTVNAVPNTPNFTTNSPVCSGNPLNLSGPAVTGATYVWSGPSSFSSAIQSPSITGSTAANAGTYNLSVIVDGCTSAVATQNVIINPTPVIAGVVTNPSGCGTNNGSIQITGTGSGSIGWTGTTLGAAPSVTLPHTINNLGTGTYNVIFISSAACTSNVVTSSLTNPSVPATPTFTANSPICAGDNVVFDAPTVANATYVWSGPNSFTSSIEDPSVTSASVAASGTYSLYVVVSNCTSATATQSVVVNAVPGLPTFTTNSPICEGNTLNLTGPTLTNVTYTWGGPNGFSSAIQNPSVSNTTSAHAGTYSLSISANGCTSAVATQNVVINPLPAIALGNVTNPSGCGSTDAVVQITGTGSGSIGWTGTTTGFNLAATLPHNINNLGAGTYSVAFISAAGCTSNVVIANITAPANPATPSFTTNTPVCEGSDISLTPTAINNATYVWSGPNGFTSTSSNPTITLATAAAAGTYSLYVVVNNCTSAASTQSVVVNPAPAIPTFVSNSPICSGSTLTLNGPTVSGATYTWSGPNGFTASTEDASVTGATSAATGTYGLYITVSGCTSATSTQALTVYDIPAAPTVSSNSPVCEGGNLNLTATAANATSYTWSGPNGWTSTSQNPTISNVGNTHNGIYDVLAIVGSCTSSVANVTVVIINSPTVVYTGPLSYCGTSIPLSATAAPVGSTINWFTPLAAGSGSNISYNYTGTLPATLNAFVTASNAANCSDTAFFSVQLNENPVADFTFEDLCDSSSVELNEQHALGGNANATFEWSWSGGSSTLSNPTNDFGAPGTYPITLIVTNAGTVCSDTITKNITILSVPTLSFTYEAKCLQEVVFTGTSQPGDSTLTNPEWNFGDGQDGSGNSTSHTYSEPNTYIVTWSVENANSCVFTATQNVEVKLSKASIPNDLPNVFTPNGDDVNNAINFDEILGECGEYEAIIYNRWGAPVFNQKNGTAPFTGKSPGGSALSEGVYYYVLKYGESQKGGSLTLAR